MNENKETVIALAGNPNVGKSTIFNRLTGMKQHTGNWPGKTVEVAQGRFMLGNIPCLLVDLPGTYSLSANSEDEEVARDFICFGDSEAVVVVSDATALERNLNLLLQVLEMKGKAVLCVNLLDEAEKKHIGTDLEKLEKLLAIPVAGTGERGDRGMDYLLCCMQEGIASVPKNKKWVKYPIAIELALSELQNVLPETKCVCGRWVALKLLENNTNAIEAVERNCMVDLHNTEITEKVMALQFELAEKGIDCKRLKDICVAERIKKAEKIAGEVTVTDTADYGTRDRKLDGFLTSGFTGIPLMLLMLCVVFWITIVGANYPSDLLGRLLFGAEKYLRLWLGFLPDGLSSILIDGMYHTLAWVVSVMLPPMAIFFPLFALLEDSGFLPRIAFNMDKCLSVAGAHGRQALTMCQGFGCNACGVMGCRIINSPRERLIAVLTNNFVPCNGRFPTIIVLIALFFSAGSNIGSALYLLGAIALGVAVTLLVSKALSMTVLKGQPTSVVMELPPYRKPQVFKVIVRSFVDRTFFVLTRAVISAVPAGALIWLLANVKTGDSSILNILGYFLDSIGRLMGMDGFILLAFLLGFPANEIVIPILIMCYTRAGFMTDFTTGAELGALLRANGWDAVTAACVIVFSVMHFPCATTCQTIYKETKSLKWTAAAVVIPTVTGFVVCTAINLISQIFK